MKLSLCLNKSCKLNNFTKKHEASEYQYERRKRNTNCQEIS